MNIWWKCILFYSTRRNFFKHNLLYEIQRLLSCHAKQQLSELTNHHHISNRSHSKETSYLNTFLTYVTIDCRYIFFVNQRLFFCFRYILFQNTYAYCFNEYKCQLVSKEIFCVEKWRTRRQKIYIWQNSLSKQWKRSINKNIIIEKLLTAQETNACQ